MHDASAPVVPPVPPVPLTALLARAELGLRQVAGPTAAGRALLGVHASEMADPYPYLLGGELLLTAGAHAPPQAAAGAGWEEYVARVVEAGAAALGFGIAPVHEAPPPALVAACERRGLPLVEVPRRTTFSAVARAVAELMARAGDAELRRVAGAQRGLAGAAAGAEPVAAVVRELAGRLGCWAALLPGGGRDAAVSAGAAPAAPVRRAVAALAEVVRGERGGAGAAPSTAAGAVGELPVTVYALGGADGPVLAVAGGRRGPGDHAVLGTAAVLLSLLGGAGAGHGPTPAVPAALLRMLLGAGADEVAPLLGAERWRLVHARPGEDGGGTERLAAALGAALVDAGGAGPHGARGGAVRLLVPADTDPSEPGRGAVGPTVVPGWTLGVSGPVAAGELAAADRQAARALARAVAGRAPLVVGRGADEGLAALVGPEEAAAHARALLAPLAGAPALTRTLHGWLAWHGSWDRTAAALGVHRNTVRQRIARCAALLDADLDDPDVRMELWFALRNSTI
ncbi:PucR family transcriptional regulator [Streptomyces sp. NPDC050560]|uniref:PucR family transcriptional regulator n=1 Tax=Streptomyces sp. NPDC050560 TaxID=3365630 RepID=UPI003798BEF4